MSYFSLNDEMLRFEREKWDAGYRFVAGVDEAGRGPLAGPVVIAAVVFTDKTKVPLVDDSKKLTPSRREEYRKQIISTPGVLYKIVVIPPDIIDSENILRATHIGMRRSVSGIENAEFALIDGLPVPDFPLPCQAVVKGDAKSASIAAASILAKTERDMIMRQYDEKYPEYGFARHSGYGTAAHMEALKKYGPTPIHRRSFAPVRNLISPPPEQLELF